MNGITNMTGMNKVINMKIGNKNKFFFTVKIAFKIT